MLRWCACRQGARRGLSAGRSPVAPRATSLREPYLEEADNTATFAFTEVQLNPFPLLETIGRGKLLIELPSDTPVDVQLETLDSPVTLNMTRLRLERLNVKVQRGNVILTLPSYDPAFSTSGWMDWPR
jgi:hypothetical protein